eukprot:4534513-Prymnesium_polylepis.1
MGHADAGHTCVVVGAIHVRGSLSAACNIIVIVGGRDGPSAFPALALRGGASTGAARCVAAASACVACQRSATAACRASSPCPD